MAMENSWHAADHLGNEWGRTSWLSLNLSLGPAVPSYPALSGRLKFAVRGHTFNQYSSSLSADHATVARKLLLLRHLYYSQA